MTMPPLAKPKKNEKLLPENERYMRACSDIANALIQEYESQMDPTKPKKDVNLNKLRATVSKKHVLTNQPSLTAIIAAVPEHYKKYILPKLIAKPISMCPAPFHIGFADRLSRDIFRHCCCRRDVQTPPLSSYRIYWKYLRLLPWWS